MAATPRQLRVYNLHKRVCKRLGIPQWNFFHRSLEGAITVGGLADVYRAPGTVQDLPAPAPTPVWLSLIPQQIRGQESNAADTAAGMQSIVKTMAQIPAIDDNGNVLTVLDDDWVVSPAGTRFKMENPVISADEAYWTFSMQIWS